MRAARKYQSIYPYLRSVDIDEEPLSSIAFTELKNHIIELGHTSVKDRVEELKTVKRQLPDSVYQQRKQKILSLLCKLLLGQSSGIVAIRDPDTGEVVREPRDIAKCLTNYWQQSFDRKDTDSSLRSEWLGRITDKLQVSLEDLRPTIEDVETVLSTVPASAPGPDGIPFSVFKRMMDIVAPLVHDIILEMIDGRGAPPTDFNFAYLICLPKGSGELVDGGLRCYDASSTRPLSIVDSINRIIASVFRLVLERQVHTWISYQQRGFVCGRQMLLNIIDVDFAAQKISIKSARGAILLLDFRAAFPSMCHSFIWDTLESIGLPRQFIKALQLVYV